MISVAPLLIQALAGSLFTLSYSTYYAQLAGLRPEFGLYSSLMGVVVYPIFATSKDVSVGPVAVMSLQTHNVIVKVMDKTNEWSVADNPN